MMKGYLVCFFICLLVCSAVCMSNQDNNPSERTTFQLQVRDAKTGYGIPATMFITGESFSRETEYAADKYGKLSIALSNDGTYSYRVESANHKPISSYVVVSPSMVKHFQIWLDPVFLPEQIKALSTYFYSGSAYAILYGFVVDSSTYQPLPMAKVQVKEMKAETYTDNDGFFFMQVPVSVINLQELPSTSSLLFSKEGYDSFSVDNTFIIPGDASSFLVTLKKGTSTEMRDDTHKLLQPLQDTQLNIAPVFTLPVIPTAPPHEPFLLVWDPPDSIRVGTNCSCTVCSTVDIVSLETYVERGLNDEWIGSWATHSLRSGAVPYRSYGTYYIYNPINANYDICSSTCCQVYDTDTNANCVAAADYTAGFLLQRNNSIFRSEYSAENNNYLCTDSGCSNSDCTCGDAYAGSPATSWPCISDSVCAGTTCYGHGRGMCQWGTQRWASTQAQSWKWIVNHYYNNNGSPGGYRSAYFTSPDDISSASPNPSTISPGETFTINVSALNYAELTQNQIMIGASIYSASTGYISDPPNDTKVTLASGSNNVSRPFAVPVSTPDGLYDLVVALWFDIDENNQITSTDLALITKTYAGVLTVVSCPLPPPTVGNTLMLYKSAPNIVLDWPDISGAVSYKIYRTSTPSDPFPSGWSLLSQPTSSTYIDLVLTDGTDYYYLILSVDACGNSG